MQASILLRVSAKEEKDARRRTAWNDIK